MATPFLNLENPILSETDFNGFITIYNANLDIIDGLGNLNLSSINVDGNFSLNNNLMSECLAIHFVESTVTPNFNNSIYFDNGELHIRDGAGRIIQVTSSGDLSAAGALRGNKITESPVLGTSGLRANQSFPNFTLAIPANLTGKYELNTYGFNFIKSGYNPTLGDVAMFGWVVDLDVNGTIVDTAVIPFSLRKAGLATVSKQTDEYPLYVGSNSQGVKVNFDKGIDGKDRMECYYTSTTMPANSKLVFYEAQIRGQKGDPAPAEVAETIYYGLVSYTPLNPANLANSQDTANIFGRASTQATSSTTRSVKQVRDITLGGAYLTFSSPGNPGYYSPWVALRTDDVTNVVFDENTLWTNAGNVTIGNVNHNVYVRKQPLLLGKTLNVIIKNYD